MRIIILYIILTMALLVLATISGPMGIFLILFPLVAGAIGAVLLMAWRRGPWMESLSWAAQWSFATAACCTILGHAWALILPQL